MRKLVQTTGALLCLVTCVAQGMSSEERMARIGRMRGYLDGVTQLLLPGFNPRGINCADQLTSAQIVMLPRYDESVFDFRVLQLLSQRVRPEDFRLGMAFVHLAGLENLVRKTPLHDLYILPGRADAQSDAPFEGVIEPRTLAYAARGMMSFAQATLHKMSERRAPAFWATLQARFSAPSGGFVEWWKPASSERADTISHASTIYPWTASGYRMFERYPAIEGHRALLQGSTRAALAMLRPNQLPFEYLNAHDLSPVPEGVRQFYGQGSQVTILGHYAQLLNFLLRAQYVGIEVQAEEIPAPLREFFPAQNGRIDLRATVVNQLHFLLTPRFIDFNSGQILNGFFQHSSAIVWNENRAFWQQCEFIALLDRVLRTGLVAGTPLETTVNEILLRAIDSLDSYFEKNGSTVRPVAAVVTSSLRPEAEDRAFMIPILGYHLLDLLDQLEER